jgi:hypothetical protein
LRFHIEINPIGTFPRHSAGTDSGSLPLIRELLTAEQRKQLLENGRQQREAITQFRDAVDFEPVVRLIATDTNAIWFLSEIDPDDNDIAFGLCDLGIGFPEVGNMRLSDLATFRGPLHQPIVRDDSFAARFTIGQYAAIARASR